MPSRTPFVFVFSGGHHIKGTCERKDSGCGSDVGGRRRFESTGRNIWRPPWGPTQNTVPPARTRKIQEMRSTRQGPAAPNGGEALTLQQVMEMMRALQEEVVASRANQERIQADLVASQATSEELCRDLQTHAAEREGADQEPATPPKEFPTPFSQEIVDATIPTTLVGPKVTFTGMEDLEAHLTTFHTQMMLVGGSNAVRCKLFMTTLAGTTMD